MELGAADELLLKQLCLHNAFPFEATNDGSSSTRPGSLLPHYLTGRSRLLLENFPELGFFRDIVFLFKLHGAFDQRAARSEAVDAL